MYLPQSNAAVEHINKAVQLKKVFEHMKTANAAGGIF